MQNVGMKRDTHDNDNEELSFITLGAVTLNVVRYLQTDEKQNGESHDDTDRREADEKNNHDHREAVQQRLRDISAFERRYIRRN